MWKVKLRYDWRGNTCSVSISKIIDKTHGAHEKTKSRSNAKLFPQICYPIAPQHTSMLPGYFTGPSTCSHTLHVILIIVGHPAAAYALQALESHQLY